MEGRLILGLIWLTFVNSEAMHEMPKDDSSMSTKMSMSMPGIEDQSSVDPAPVSTKSKRFFHHPQNHGSSSPTPWSPCPPFYPHFDLHVPMHAMRPYGPPAYPKKDVHVAPVHQQVHQASVQYIHQPTYMAYVPKQTVDYVKPQVISAPIYHQPVAPSPPVHHGEPITAIVKHLPQPIYYNYPKPMIDHKYAYEKQPAQHVYAPAYPKPMSSIWSIPQVKKIDYPITQVHYEKPLMMPKPEPPKCAPCSPAVEKPQHPPQTVQTYHQPSISYVKIPQPTIQHIPQEPPKFYLPAPVHQPIVKPCVK